MTDEELVDDGEALGWLEHDGTSRRPLAREPRARSLEWTFTFPPQQHHFDEGDGGEDPREGGTGWTVSAIDNATRRRAPAPEARKARRAAADLARSRAARIDDARRSRPRCAGSPHHCSPATARYPHLERLLRREPPLGGEPLQRRELADQRALLDRLESSYLVVQGPPGSGKTYRGARLITHLLAQGQKVGVTAQSHKVIHNMLDEVERAAAEEGLRLPWHQARRPLRERARRSRART